MQILKESWQAALRHRFYPWAIKEALWLAGGLIKDDPTRELPALNYFKRAGLNYLYKSYSQGTVWTTIFIPPELLYALGLTPFCMEVVAAIFAGYEKAISVGLQEAESQDVPTDVCTFHRLALGSALRGFFPQPILLAGSTMLCDSGIKSLKLAAAFTGKRLVTIDVPIEMSKEAIKYVAQQLEELTKAIEKATGRRRSVERLREAILCSNRSRAKIQEINEMRAHPLCPLKGSSALSFMLTSHILLGSQEAEEFYQRLALEIKEHLHGRGNPPARPYNPSSPIRILWLEGKPYFHCNLMAELEERHGVKLVFDELNYVYWEALDPDQPYEGMARKLISHHMNGQIERRLEVIKRLARKYSVDGIIAFSHWGCRRHLAAVPTLKRELEREGYPFLNLDGDCVDSRNYMPGQFATRIEGFLEILRGRPGVRVSEKSWMGDFSRDNIRPTL
jgi:benzoyl-CoA reductase/2-hydroxyglutaryl-CoA dehydratase subunit BcrC/BadD/HgdB